MLKIHLNSFLVVEKVLNNENEKSLPSKVIQVIVSTIAWYNLVIQSRWRSIGAGSITLTSIRSTANIVQTHVVELLLLSKQIRNVIGM